MEVRKRKEIKEREYSIGSHFEEKFYLFRFILIYNVFSSNFI